MTMYEAIVFMSSSGMNRNQINDIIHAIIDDTLYIQGKEARLYAMCQMKDYYYYHIKEREEQNNETNK